MARDREWINTGAAKALKTGKRNYGDAEESVEFGSIETAIAEYNMALLDYKRTLMVIEDDATAKEAAEEMINVYLKWMAIDPDHANLDMLHGHLDGMVQDGNPFAQHVLDQLGGGQDAAQHQPHGAAPEAALQQVEAALMTPMGGLALDDPNGPGDCG